MSGFDFLEEAEDSTGAPDAEAEMPEESEEVVADDTDDDGAQDEPDHDEGLDSDEDEEEELPAIELDGEFITLDEIRDMKKGGLREQDYTKKTQELAEERKQLTQKYADVDSAIASLSSIEDEVKGLLVADLEEIDLKELRKNDYEEYLKVKEDISDRQKMFDDLKAKAAEASKVASAERSKELADLMGWGDKAKYKQDVESFQSLAGDLGLGNADVKTLTSPKIMAAMFELAQLKKASKAKPPKGKPKKVKISKRSAVQASKPKASKSFEDELESYFDDKKVS